MNPITNLPPADREKIKYVLCDIDDTLTTDGKLSAEAYSALWKLGEAGYQVIPVTGRPAGWCDMIIRQWPVRAVIGENGAFVYYTDGGKIKTFTHPSVAHPEIRQRLADVQKAVLERVPDCRISRDQFSRLYDLAIDFNEDPPYLGLEAAEQITQVCEEMGAVAKISSIHVNTWFGDYNKLDMTLLFFRQVLGESDPKQSIIFFGDSPNDEPMFSYFPNSCGVANVRDFEGRMKNLPTYITNQRSGLGFAEAAELLIRRNITSQ